MIDFEMFFICKPKPKLNIKTDPREPIHFSYFTFNIVFFALSFC